MIIEVPLDLRSIRVGLWQVNVGRVKLYLLDTNVEGNSPYDRELSARLYAGDQEMRLQQAIIIGVGGVRALRALDIQPTIWHANEGYTAFMTLERIRELVAEGLDFTEAARRVQATTVFTIHSLVPGGNDSFSRHLVENSFHRYVDWLKVDKETLLELGALETDKSVFNMTMLGLRMAYGRNGVSLLHGGLCRQSCGFIWPGVKEKDVPVTSVTNGVHSFNAIAKFYAMRLTRTRIQRS